MRNFIVFFLISHAPLRAAIDAGGSWSALGSFGNHSSIGSPFSSSSETLGNIEIVYATWEPTPDQDADGNGIADIWEQEFFGTHGVNPSHDNDGDGANNMMEFVAGTIPTDPKSSFRLSLRHQVGGMSLSIPTVVGRTYRVWGRDSLSNQTQGWTLHDTFTGSGVVVEWTFSPSQAPNNRWFFRIEIIRGTPAPTN